MAAMIWVPHATESWVPAYVLADKGDKISVRVRGNSAETLVPGPLNKYDIVSETSLEEVCENLVDLENYSEGIILHHIRTRFVKGSIYTFVGNILVAVNPYQSLDIYGIKVMEEAFMSIRKIEAKMRPHVFSIAAMTLANMREEGKSQCVLISGESGAGKTETTKKILQFISTMSQSSSSRGSISVENQILDSNPILESFGNAKTIRNNNSSRFGKYMEINFDKKNCIKGCNITSYLLEKTRVVKVTQLERNYHIFYMLVAGASTEQRKEFSLRTAEQFSYLIQGQCISINRRDDAEEYRELVKAMNNLGFDEKFQHDVYQTLAGILHLGNLEFSPKSDEGSVISSSNDCKIIAKLLGLSDADLLEKTLCYRENIVSKEVFMIPLNPARAKDQRDALAKFIYGRIFDIIVTYVNASLFRGKLANNIGILDIFGFEVFVENSFEQLCINYCNERLQTFFNEIIFEGEMKMYVADGVNCDDITFQDNIDCVRLIDLKGSGIFSILDEQVILPGGSDDKFLQKLNQIFDENASTKSLYYVRNRRKPKEFGISHFAGDVGYNVENFLEKNKDALATGLVKLINSSSVQFIHSVESEAERTAGAIPAPTGRSATKMTLSAKFKLDLDNLMTALRSTTPYFIRCIKPNDFQQADRFDSPLTLNQLKYSGLFEAVSIRKAGYAIRMQHRQFIERYKHCSEPKLPSDLIESDPRLYCQLLFEQIYPRLQGQGSTPPPPPPKGTAAGGARTTPPPPPPPPGKAKGSNGRVSQSWCVGLTRVYIRTQELKIQLDKYRRMKGENLIYHIQKLARGFITRRRTFKLFGVSREQKMRDKKLAELERSVMEKEDKLSLENEIIFRNDMELQKRILEAKKARIRAENERKMKIAISAALTIQRCFRGRIGRTKGRRYMVEKIFERAIESQGHQEILHAVAMQRKYNVTSKLIRSYQYHSKALILNMFNESHVINALEDAIATGNEELLASAIDLTEKNNMMYLPAYQVAKQCLERSHQKHRVIDLLEQELRLNTNTIPKLIRRIDIIQDYIHQALRLGLAASEAIVHEAAIRINKVSNLIKTRNEMRQAVELCSENRILRLLEERNKLCRVFGDELFDEEANAMHGMIRMLRYDKQITEQYRIDTVLAQKAMDVDNKPPTTTPTRAIYDLDDEEDAEEKSQEPPSYGDPGDDIKLPGFVRQVLDKIHFASSRQELQEAEHELQLLVPIPAKQRIYRRLFKWVVAQATWRYSKPTDEELASNLKSVNLFEEKDPMPLMIDSLKTSTSPNKSKKLSKSSSSSPKATANSSSILKNTSSRSTKLSSSTLVKAKVKDVFRSIDEILVEHGLDPVPDKSSRGARGADDTKSLATTTAAEGILFAQRSSKSQVAAYQALKIGKKMASSSHSSYAADRMIDEAIQEYDRFYGKHRIEQLHWK